MPLFKKRFPRKTGKITRLKRAQAIKEKLHKKFAEVVRKVVAEELEKQGGKKPESLSPKELKLVRRELKRPEPSARSLERQKIAQLWRIARDRSKKAEKLVGLRRRINAVRQAGFIVKRKK